MKSLLLAIQFLSILPVTVKGDVDEGDMLSSAVWFPVVGLMQGAVLFATALGLGYIFPSYVSAAIVLFLLVLSFGGLHLDGLADTVDAIGCKGDRERRLAVMRDSAVGPLGALGMFFALLIKYAALVGVIDISASGAGWGPLALAVIFMPALSKWVMLLGMRLAVPSRPDGLGALFIGRLPLGASVAGGLLLLLLMTATVMLAGWSCFPVWHVFSPMAIAVILLYAIIHNRVMLRIFGGQSGDTLGASGEIAEVIYLLMVVAWSRHFIS